MEDRTIDLFKTQPSEPAQPQFGNEKLTFDQALELTTMFDTQPKYRAERLKQFGFEMNPKDPNQYKKPGGQYMEIDQAGIGPLWKELKKLLKNKESVKDIDWSQFSKSENYSEIARDAIEGVLDLVQGAAIEGIGTGAAAAIAPTGPGAIAARSAGRASTYQYIESIKDDYAKTVLGTQMQPDQGLRMIQTAIQAVGPEALKPALGFGKKVFEAVAEGAKGVMGIGGNRLNDATWRALGQRPFYYGDSGRIQGASTALKREYQNIFGITDTDKIPSSIWEAPDGLLAKKLAEKEVVRKGLVQELSKNPANNVPASDVLRLLESHKSNIKSYGGVTSEETGALLGWLEKKIAQVKESIPEGADPRTHSISFSWADNWVKEMQKDVYQPNLTGVRRVVDGFVDDSGQKLPGLNLLLKAKSPAYAQVKEQEKRIIDAFDSAKTNLKFQNVASTVIGGFQSGNAKKDLQTDAVRAAVQQVDDALEMGGQLTKNIEEGQVFNNLYEAFGQSGKPRGSGGKVAVMTAAASPFLLADPFFQGAGKLAAPAAVTAAALSEPAVGVPLVAGATRMAQGLAGAQEVAGANTLAGAASRFSMDEMLQPYQDKIAELFTQKKEEKKSENRVDSLFTQ